MKLNCAVIVLGLGLAGTVLSALADNSISISQTGGFNNDAYVEQSHNVDAHAAITQRSSNSVAGNSTTHEPGILQTGNTNVSASITQNGSVFSSVVQRNVTNGSVSVDQGVTSFGFSETADVVQENSKNVKATVSQDFIHEVASITQRDVSDGIASITQVGQDTGSIIQENSSHVHADISQSGLFDNASVTQRNVVDATASLSQNVASGIGTIMQENGMNLAATLHQDGFGHNASINQQGSWNDASILQSGSNNRATIAQVGDGTTFADRNIATIDQSGNGLVASIRQNGYLQHAGIIQR